MVYMLPVHISEPRLLFSKERSQRDSENTIGFLCKILVDPVLDGISISMKLCKEESQVLHSKTLLASYIISLLINRQSALFQIAVSKTPIPLTLVIDFIVTPGPGTYMAPSAFGQYVNDNALLR